MLAAVDLGLLDSVIQPMRPAADLRGDRYDGLQARLVLAFAVQYRPHGAVAHFGRKLVRGLAHDNPFYSGVGSSSKPGAVTPLGAVTRWYTVTGDKKTAIIAKCKHPTRQRARASASNTNRETKAARTDNREKDADSQCEPMVR